MANYITDILVPAQSLSFKASSDGYYSAEVSVDGYYFPSGTGNKRIGEVVFDGESFIGHWEYESSAGVTYHFGNLSLKGSGEDSGEPFLLSYNYSAKKVTVITNSTEATHTVACYLFADLSYISVQHTTGYIHAGIDVNDLTGLTVTATFTDSTKRTVTGYTLEGDSSGKTLEGKNVIIVKWEGEATRITLIGVLDNAVSISATYTGGIVDAWISVNELTGVTVIAHLDDGTSVPVTGYTLSGKLVAGVNVVTVTYGELTTTFEVTAYASIVLKDRDGVDTRYMDVLAVKLKQSDGSKKTFVSCEMAETTVQPDFSNGDIEVLPGEGELLSKVTIEKPETLIPENILKNKVIAGIVGTCAGFAAAGGIFTGNGKPYTLNHGLGTVPDLIWLHCTTSGGPATSEYRITKGIAISKKLKELSGYARNCHELDVQKQVSSSSSSSMMLAYAQGIEESGGCIHDANENTIIIGNSTYPTKAYQYFWFAVGGLT